jgi:hypothetical protein
MSEGNKNTPTDFGAESKAASVIAAAKRKRIPVGGAPIQMPRLDQLPPAMQQANAQAVRSAQRVLTQEEREQLITNGQFHPGVGSGYAANQPAMGYAMPKDQDDAELPIDPKLVPRPPGSGLRPKTVADLEAVAAANSSSKANDEDLKKINKEIDEIDEVFETNEFGERVKSLLGNKERARAIESRCKPLALEDLLLYSSVQQTVPIVPGKFEPTFRSPQGDENIEILRLMSSLRGSEDYIMDMLSLYRLTAGLFALNAKPLPNHLDKNGDFNEEMFKAKNKIILKMALPILADMSVNFNWFSRRVQKLTVIDDIRSF